MTPTHPRTVAELAERFASVDPTYGPVPIWWWSGARLERRRLRWQLEQLRAGGVHQAVVICLAPRGPLYGSLADDPPFLSGAWWDIFLGACEDAHEVGFRFWLYDQFGFSGANFQGQLTAAHPSWAGQELHRIEQVAAAGETVTLRPPSGSSALAAYVVTPDRQPQPIELDDDGAATWSGTGRVCLCYAQSRGFDYYDREACAQLIDTVLGEFRRRAEKWFGPVITGLFQDELPQLPTWGKAFADSFAVAHGYDLVDRISSLWEGDDEAAAAVRRDYHAHRAALARDAFFQPYAAWAEAAGLVAGFDQQTPAREGDPAGATELYGDYLGTHAGFTAPGSDHWGDPKVHSSLAHANGHPRTWIEAFHSSGWGGTLEETYDWLGPFLRRGANLYDPHAVYYATVGGWWEWAAPSTCWRQPYWPTYRVFADAVTRLCSLTSAGQLVADTVLLYPTSTVQADLAADGPGPRARRASEAYNEVNGSTCWFDERPGVLDRAGHDYEILDEATLLDGDVTAAEWHVAGGAFRNIVLPAVSTLDSRLASRLARFASDGGTVVCVAAAPQRFLGSDPSGGAAFAAAVAAGEVRMVDDAADLPAHLVRGPVTVDADVPYMLRRYGDTLVLLLVAHDETTGTHLPSLRRADGFNWKTYWSGLSERGYDFLPVGDRRAHLQITGAPGYHAQRWDPRSGDRVQLDVEESADGALRLDVPFADGSMSVVVLAPDLPAATRVDADGPATATVLDDGWELAAHSTLDNRWGDLGDPRVTGTLPIEVWRMQHAVADGDWQPALASYGPYVRVKGPSDDDWKPFEFSLSRGIRNDPLHFTSLGPKGMVPEEFLRWEEVDEGDSVAFAASLDLPDGIGRMLALGADADRTVFVDGSPVGAGGTGYWTTSALPDGPRRVQIEVWLRAGAVGRGDVESERELRATFAVVTDTERFRRPEWLQPADGAASAGTVCLSGGFDVQSAPEHAVVQIATEGACSILLNGTEIGRQGAFEPYWARRRPQLMPYDLTRWIRPGRNEIVLRIDDPGGVAAALVDGDLGLVTDLTWTCTRDGVDVPVRMRREQWLDPRWVCLRARPHPLPRAAWLDPSSASDGVVLDLVPDAWDDGPRTEWLRFVGPVGATELHVPTDVPFEALVDGRTLPTRDGVVHCGQPLPAGTTVTLRFDAVGGERAGGLLRGPVQVVTAPVPAALADWATLGLRALGGYVSYRREIDVDPPAGGDILVLDLGEVRGSAEVRVNGTLAATMIWSPYRADVTPHLRAGRNELQVIVRGTLAGYLDDASPTPAVGLGQTRHGLLGPVRLLRYGA